MRTRSKGPVSAPVTTTTGGGGVIRHDHRALLRGREARIARALAEKDIKNGTHVLADLPMEVQLALKELAKKVARGEKGVQRKKTDKYIISVGYVSTEKAKRSEKTPTPVAESKATYRMLGTVDTMNGFSETCGTSYTNIQPVGLDHLYDTLTQSSHVFPSVLASETDRVTGNTGVTKSSFVNQTFDRGSEDQIMKEAAELKEPVFVGVEILE